jgi:ribonuclease Z
VIKDEARAIFPNTVVPRDFDTIELPLPERGAPELRRGGAHPEEEKAR